MSSNTGKALPQTKKSPHITNASNILYLTLDPSFTSNYFPSFLSIPLLWSLLIYKKMKCIHTHNPLSMWDPITRPIYMSTSPIVGIFQHNWMDIWFDHEKEGGWKCFQFYYVWCGGCNGSISFQIVQKLPMTRVSVGSSRNRNWWQEKGTRSHLHTKTRLIKLGKQNAYLCIINKYFMWSEKNPRNPLITGSSVWQ